MHHLDDTCNLFCENESQSGGRFRQLNQNRLFVRPLDHNILMMKRNKTHICACAPGEQATHWSKDRMSPTASIGNWNNWMKQVKNGTVTPKSSKEAPKPTKKKEKEKRKSNSETR